MRNKSNPFVSSFLLVGLLAGAIFVLDTNIPLGVDGGVLYVSLILVGAWRNNRKLIICGAVTGSLLTVAGFFLSPPGGILWQVLTNRLLALSLIVLTTILCLRKQRAEQLYRASHDELEKRVNDRTAKLYEAHQLLKKEASYVQLHKDIAVIANEPRPKKETMELCLKRICAHTGWPVGHLYLPDARFSTRLRSSEIWFLEDAETFQTFREITAATPFEAGVGLPGRVLETGKPAWIMDVTEDPNFPRAKLVENFGVKAGFAFPILIGKNVVGVMEFFSAHAVEPNSDLLEIMAQIGTQLGRVIERKHAQEDNEQAREQLRNLYHRLELVREEERTRLAREVHDELGQMLTTLKLELSLLARKLPVGQPGARENVKLMQDLIDNSIHTVKKIAMDLRPLILDHLGLSEAIDWQGREFAERTGVEWEFHHGTGNQDLDQDRATTVFRIFQEILTNVARHSKASQLEAKLLIEDKGVTLEVKDNGVGISPDQISDLRSLGLLGMRERALVWGGHVEIKGEPNQGTLVTLNL